jgi:ProP effector
VLSAFLRRYTGSTTYIQAVSRATHRFDLDGQEAGELTDEHRHVALTELARRRERQVAKRAEQEQGLRDRANLLRDFERTTLTAANFCALKGLTEEALQAQLTLARTEAAQAPAQPDRRPHHPGQRPGQGPHGRRDQPPGQRRDQRGEQRGDQRAEPRGQRQGPSGKPRAGAA